MSVHVAWTFTQHRSAQKIASSTTRMAAPKRAIEENICQGQSSKQTSCKETLAGLVVMFLPHVHFLPYHQVSRLHLDLIDLGSLHCGFV